MELRPHQSTCSEPLAETSSEPLSSLHCDSGFAAAQIRQPQSWLPASWAGPGSPLSHRALTVSVNPVAQPITLASGTFYSYLSVFKHQVTKITPLWNHHKANGSEPKHCPSHVLQPSPSVLPVHKDRQCHPPAAPLTAYRSQRASEWISLACYHPP